MAIVLRLCCCLVGWAVNSTNNKLSCWPGCSYDFEQRALMALAQLNANVSRFQMFFASAHLATVMAISHNLLHKLLIGAIMVMVLTECRVGFLAVGICENCDGQKEQH